LSPHDKPVQPVQPVHPEPRPEALPEALIAVVGEAPGAPGLDGIFTSLGSRASLGMDVVVVGLVALLPILAWSITAVRRGRYGLHKRLQLLIVAALAAAIVFFEVDIRFLSDWRERARPSGFWPGGVVTALAIHLVFAISTFVLWVWVMWEALARFPSPPAPGSHGLRHRVMARLAAIDLVITALTGGIFYWLAFVS
jgi:uncharacterized membrane protein YozB (DUF420 family)